MLKRRIFYFCAFIFLIGKINSQNSQVTFSLPKENHFCTNTGIITLPQGYPIGGIYYGLGVSGNTFDTNVYPGVYEIQYEYKNPETGILVITSDKLSLQNCKALNNTENLNNINIYPNETINLWIIENALGLKCEVVNLLGFVIHETSFINTKQVIDLHKAPRGIYCVRIKDKNGTIITWENISLDN